MKVYTYSEARRQLAEVLDRASKEGEVQIRRRDGTQYVLRPCERGGSPLDVDSVQSDVSAADIVLAVRESRERTGS